MNASTLNLKYFSPVGPLRRCPCDFSIIFPDSKANFSSLMDFPVFNHPAGALFEERGSYEFFENHNRLRLLVNTLGQR